MNTWKVEQVGSVVYKIPRTSLNINESILINIYIYIYLHSC